MTAYSIKTALSGLWREKWINLLSVLTIAIGLFLVSICLMLAYNARLALKGLPDKFSITVFLDKNSAENDVANIKAELKSYGIIKKIKYISKENALSELKAAMKDSDFILEGLDENPLPASFEIRLDKSSVTWDGVKRLASDVKKIKGVSDVQYGREFLSAIQSINRSFNIVGAAVVSSLTAGIFFVCYSTVKILFYRKKDEIETLKFLGATKGFIRRPFVIEGGIIGLAGGLACSMGMFFFYQFLSGKLAMSVPLLRTLVMPTEFLASPPAAGLIIGMVGSLIAVGRVRF